MLRLEFEVEGEKLLSRKIEALSAEMEDWSKTFGKTSEYLKKTFKDNFATSGSLLEKPWAPLSPSTIAFKQRHGFPLAPLIRTGTMMDSFASEHGRFHVRVFNPVEYFKYHQSNRPRRKIPRRVMISLTEKMRRQIVKFFQEKVEKALMKRI